MQYLERILRKSGLLFKYSEGFHPRIKIAALPPLPVGAQGFAEVIEVFVAGNLEEKEVLEVLNRPLADFQFKKADFIGADISFHKELQFVDFFFAWGDIVPEREGIAAMLFAGDSFSFCREWPGFEDGLRPWRPGAFLPIIQTAGPGAEMDIPFEPDGGQL